MSLTKQKKYQRILNALIKGKKSASNPSSKKAAMRWIKSNALRNINSNIVKESNNVFETIQNILKS